MHYKTGSHPPIPIVFFEIKAIAFAECGLQ
ncbi:hypothetical protein NVIRENTERO_02148 [Sodalis praecaptivus]|nr:hypothetical protein NVIRENTERO_02148 [Sodalis praecaptivus]